MISSLRKEDDQVIAEKLRQVTDRGDSIENVLKTNDRVIARVTDGIYRQPGSAIRELIANAYDADATWVTVKTDAPKFSRITVEDNGAGMTPEVLVHLLHNIGGSAKRTTQGQDLGIASPDDSTVSQRGRKLIGKLGIGIFSVSQLTHSFQIISKTRGDGFRTIALVNLRQFADGIVTDDEEEYAAGAYQVWREPTNDIEAHGTTIVLTAIRPQTQDSLQSEQLWNTVTSQLSEESEFSASATLPKYHIGHLDDSGFHVEDDKSQYRNFPWDDGDDSTTAFKKMVDSAWSPLQGRTTVKLNDLFDTYLQMLWNLSLALPLPYVEKNILDETVADDWGYFYKLSSSNGSAEPLFSDDPDVTLRELAGLSSVEDCDDEFRVLIDGVELRRPLKFRGLPATQHALKKPMVFVGSMREDFLGFSKEVSAGPIEFEAYLFWTPRVAPTEHQGALVRIHGASGTLFDSTFFNYQVAELTRLRQITCEIFVKEGLEAALNIDRESFNTAHPHTVVLTQWLHNALRQLATAQKREAQRIRKAAHESTSQQTESQITRIIDTANETRTGGEGLVPQIRFKSIERSAPETAPEAANEVTQSFDLDRILSQIPGTNRVQPKPINIQKLKAITTVLSVYSVLDQLSRKEQDNLLGSVLGILEAENLD